MTSLLWEGERFYYSCTPGFVNRKQNDHDVTPERWGRDFIVVVLRALSIRNNNACFSVMLNLCLPTAVAGHVVCDVGNNESWGRSTGSMSQCRGIKSIVINSVPVRLWYLYFVLSWLDTNKYSFAINLSITHTHIPNETSENVTYAWVYLRTYCSA